jgi:translocation and assembly module TamB
LFGVSRIKIDPQGLTSETNVVRGPQVTIEQQVASNLTITYSTNVSVATQQIIQLEYNVTRNISIVALRDQNGVVSFDVKIRQRKRWQFRRERLVLTEPRTEREAPSGP